jgi:hypothetical protein
VTEQRNERTERLYAQAEQKLEGVKARQVARGPVSLIGVSLALCLAVGVVAAVDLRRLQTPLGTALGFTGAAVFGDCEAYQRLSVPDPAAGAPEPRSDAQLCTELRARTEPARAQAALIAITASDPQERGREAKVDVVVRRPDGERSVTLDLVRKDGGWAVVRTAPTCLAVGCA